MPLQFAALGLTLAFVVQPLPPMQCARPRAAAHVAMVDAANDGADVNWDEEAKKLGKLSKPMNPFYKAVSDIDKETLIGDFVQSAPKEVIFAVKSTVASLLGSLPPQVADSSITTTGKNLATLMFNMQSSCHGLELCSSAASAHSPNIRVPPTKVTGYMFRNAEYRRSLKSSLDTSLPAADEPVALPPIEGTLKVKIAEGMEAEIEASAYMAELRNEVEGLRSQLVAANKKSGDGGDEQALIKYIQTLDKADQQVRAWPSRPQAPHGRRAH